MSWLIRRGEENYSCSDVNELRALAVEGRVLLQDQIFDPRSEKWTTPIEVIEISDLFRIDKVNVKFFELLSSFKGDGNITISQSALYYSFQKLKFNLFVRIVIITIFALVGSIISIIVAELLKDIDFPKSLIFFIIVMVGWAITKKTTIQNGEIQLNEITDIKFNNLANRIDIFSNSGRMTFSADPVAIKRINQYLLSILPKK